MSAQSKSNSTIEVLFQNLAGQWFLFAEIDDEIYMSKIDHSLLLNTHKISKTSKELIREPSPDLSL